MTERAWLSWRRASILTSLPRAVLRPLLREAGVDLFRPTPRRELVDAEGLRRWMETRRVPSAEASAAVHDTVRARVRARMAEHRGEPTP